MVERIDVGSIRRAQIVQAAMKVIARKGFQNASLAEIEHEAGVSRGLLTYHYPTKEDLVLAVFDSMIEQMRQAAPAQCPGGDRTGWPRIERLIEWVILERQPNCDYDSLHYTFLAQMSHRADFQERLADLYAGMRDRLVRDLNEEAQRGGLVSCDAAAVAAIIVGALHGLAMQLNADPRSIDGRRLVAVLKAMLLGSLRSPERDRAASDGNGRVHGDVP